MIEKHKAIAALVVLGVILAAVVILAGTARAAYLPAEQIIQEAVQPPLYQFGGMEFRRAYSEDDVTMLARLVWAEARGIESRAEKAAVVWCVLNRVADDRWPDTIREVVTQRSQFAYRSTAPVLPELAELVREVLDRWSLELEGSEVYRELPREYVFFAGDGRHNYFRTAYKGGKRWVFTDG